jgi:hypothetical protein
MRIRAKEFLIVIVLGGLAGAGYYALSWAYHLPYIGLNWLGPLVGADGEKGYDAMLYESIIDFALAASVLYLLAKVVWVAIRSSDGKADHDDTSAR